jgi:hypothetical protein
MAATEEVKRTLMAALLPIAAEDSAGDTFVLGTGFVIQANGRQAYLVTAAHVVREFRLMERPNPRRHPSTPAMFRLEEHRFEIHRTTPFAIYQDPTRGACRVIIETCWEMESTDLALCSIRLGDGVALDIQFPRQFILDPTPVRSGEPIVALGYAEGRIEPIINAEGVAAWTFDGRWLHQAGTVAHTHMNGGPTGQKGSCSQCTARFDHGMSGGPVITEGPNRELHVRGTMMSDWGSEKGADIGPTALASMIWQQQLLPVGIPTTVGNIAGRTLLDLEREDAILDRGRGTAHVCVERHENGQIISAMWDDAAG